MSELTDFAGDGIGSAWAAAIDRATWLEISARAEPEHPARLGLRSGPTPVWRGEAMSHWVYPALAADRRSLLLPWSEGHPAEVRAVASGQRLARVGPPPPVGHDRCLGALARGASVAAMAGSPGVVWLWDHHRGTVASYRPREGASLGRCSAIEAVAGGPAMFVVAWEHGLELIDGVTSSRVGLLKSDVPIQWCGAEPRKRLRASPSGWKIAICTRDPATMLAVVDILQWSQVARTEPGGVVPLVRLDNAWKSPTLEHDLGHR